MTDIHSAAAPSRRTPLISGATTLSSLLIFSCDIAVLSAANSLSTQLGVLPEGVRGLQGILAVALVLWALTRGHYSRRLAFTTEASQLSQCVVGFLVLAEAVAQHQSVGGHEIALAALHGAALVAALLGARLAVRRAMDAAGLWRIPTLVIGTANAERIAAAIDSATSRGYRTVGVLHPTDTDWGLRLDAAFDHADVQMAVLEPEVTTGRQGKQLIQALRSRGIDIAMAPSLGELPVVGLQAQKFFTHDVVLLAPPPTFGRELSQGAKRLLDMLAAALALLLAAPVMVLVALAVKLDGGPLLFGHMRVGHNGTLFPCWKFRTMVPNAEAKLKEVLARDPERAEEWRQTLKLKNDPRVTAIGGFLRRSSLDELPQLFNVLFGHMSLIGPRPVTKGELERYGDAQDYYLSVRPGITGLWQVMGRNDTSYGQRVQLDAWYVRNWSLWHDIIILFKTVPAVLRRSGAY